MSYLDILCGFRPHRGVGSPGNRGATDFIVQTIGQWGYSIDTTQFNCLDFESGTSLLKFASCSYDLNVSPYSSGYSGSAKLVQVSTIEELADVNCYGKFLLVKGDLCMEQLMPKDYPFFYPDHHRAIHALLEVKHPAAIITATGKNPAMAGGMYPYPLIEDGNFNIPSAYCTDVLGDEIATQAGNVVELNIDARRIPSTACNVIARKNPAAAEKVVVCAHIDTKTTTPGALDNAAGVVVLLLLAEMLRQYHGQLGVEIIVFNGEDNYGAAGELDYLRRYGEQLDKVTMALNIDGAGYVEGKTAYSFYGCSEDLIENARTVFGGFDGITPGPEWFQGDHMVMAQNGVPAIAFTSELLGKLMADITHTPKDTPDKVDCAKLVELADAIRQMIITITAHNIETA